MSAWINWIEGMGERPKLLPSAGCGVLAVIALPVLVFLGLVASPLVHPFVFALYAHWPFFLAVFVMAIGGVIISSDQTASATTAAGGLVIAVGAIAMLALFFFGESWKKVSYLEYSSVSAIEEQPETTGVRYLPYEIAQNVGKNLASDPTVNPGELEPLVEGDEAQWIAPREPNGLMNTLFGSQKGVLLANSTSDASVEEANFSPGMGTCCFRNSLKWKAIKTRFWADYNVEPYPYVLNGETVIIQPYLGRYFDFPVMVPYFKGALLFRADGSVEDLSPEDAASKYPEGRFFPHEMVSYFADSYQYKGGIINKWFYHYDQPDVPKLSGENQFPFLIPSDQGPVWYTAVEPYGSSRSVYKAYYIDATTGDVSIYDFPEALIGPDRAESFVGAQYQELKNAVFIEPRPVVKADKLYWMLTSTTDAYTQISFTAVVDAATEEVYRLDDKPSVDRFILSGALPASSGRHEAAAEGTSAQEAAEASGTPSDEDLAKLLRQAADALEKQ